MLGHKPRSDSKPVALLNMPCHFPSPKQVHVIGYLHVGRSTLGYVPQYDYSQPKSTTSSPLQCPSHPTMKHSFLPNSSKQQFPHMQESSVFRQSDLNQNQLQAMPAASWPSISDSTVLFGFRFSEKTNCYFFPLVCLIFTD